MSAGLGMCLDASEAVQSGPWSTGAGTQSEKGFQTRLFPSGETLPSRHPVGVKTTTPYVYDGMMGGSEENRRALIFDKRLIKP
jgi:hypothetical protein